MNNINVVPIKIRMRSKYLSEMSIMLAIESGTLHQYTAIRNAKIAHTNWMKESDSVAGRSAVCWSDMAMPQYRRIPLYNVIYS